MKEKYAPIILFAHKRLITLKRVINSLKKNNLSKHSEIYIFSDGFKSTEDKKKVLKVRNFLKKLSGFKKVILVFRNYNLGLEKNMIDGISTILKKKKSGIIVEDDIIVSPNFLYFMNLCLNKYKNKKKIWHINGWNYQIKELSNGEVFYWRGMHCWGWATWHDRWLHFKKNPEQLIKIFDKKNIKRFNYDGCYNFWNQVLRNYHLKINTWAIFWYATIFLNKGLCVSPEESFTLNIGNDSSATHSINPLFINQKFRSFNTIEIKKLKFQETIIENSYIFSKIKKFLLKKKIQSFFFRLFK